MYKLREKLDESPRKKRKKKGERQRRENWRKNWGREGAPGKAKLTGAKKPRSIERQVASARREPTKRKGDRERKLGRAGRGGEVAS